MSTLRAFALGLALVACSEGGPDRTPTAILLVPSSPANLASGTTLAVAATAVNRRGEPLSEIVPTWTSSDIVVATVSSGGVVTGIRTGTTTITARLGDLASQLAVTVTPGTAAALVVTRHPSDALSGQTLGTQPMVEVRDAATNLVTSSSASITATIASGGGTLGGTVTLAAVNGVATFTDLSIRGVPGSRQLSFSSPGLVTATSFGMQLGVDPVAVAVVVTPSTTQSLTSGRTLQLTGSLRNQDGVELPSAPLTWASGNPQILQVTNAGLVTAQQLGTARIVAKTATLTSDSLAITSVPIVTFGAAGAKVIRMAPGADVTPVFSAADVFGNPAPGFVPAFVSRAVGVTSVDATGRITAIGAGAGFVVAGTAAAVHDSVYVQVPPAAGPVLRTDVTRIAHRSGDEILARVLLDTRGASVGAATLTITWPHDVFIGFLELLSVDGTTGGLATVTETGVNGQIRASFVSSAGASGVLEVMQVRLRVRPSPNPVGRSGWLTLLPQDVVAIDFSSLTSSVTPLRYPVTVSP